MHYCQLRKRSIFTATALHLQLQRVPTKHQLSSRVPSNVHMYIQTMHICSNFVLVLCMCAISSHVIYGSFCQGQQPSPRGQTPKIGTMYYMGFLIYCQTYFRRTVCRKIINECVEEKINVTCINSNIFRSFT